MKPYYDHSGITIYQGHILDVLPQLPAESIQCCVTSPPYWGLRDYNLPPQIWDDPGWTKMDFICEHEWGDELSRTHEGGGNDGVPKEWQRPSREAHKGGSSGQFCLHCNAWRGSLGLEPDPSLYIQHIVQVFREVWRVLRKDGTLWLNLGDSYYNYRPGLGSAQTKQSLAKHDGAVISEVPRRANIIAGLKEKDLCGIPWRVALALQKDGWWLRSDIIWSKPNPMPESVTDRPTRAHEYVFLLTKSGTSQFWTHRDKSGTRTKPKADWRWVNQITEEEVKVAPPDWKEKVICPNCEGKGRALIDLSYECLGLWTEYWKEDECPICEGKKKVQKWKRINLWQGHDYFYDADAVKETSVDPESLKGRTKRNKRKCDLTGDPKLMQDFYKIPAGKTYPGRNLRSVWTIATEPTPEAHFATFPEKLVIPCIKSGTSEKGCCPECGSSWVRVVEKMQKGKTLSETPGTKNAEMYVSRYGSPRLGPSIEDESKTIGWKPSCECGNAKTMPCTVLDPFLGSGKALIVAQKFGRKGIGSELNPEYCKMPLKKIAQNRMF